MITFDNVTLCYDRHPAIHHLNGVVKPGSLLVITGPNGAGKSTLLKAILGQLKPSQGRIDITGIQRQDIAYLPQQINLDKAFPIQVLDAVCMGYWRVCGVLKGISAEQYQNAEAALVKVGLAGFGGRRIDSLSGGQFQRVLFARMMLQQASLLLLDEPFTAIDASTTDVLLALIQQWHQQQRTVIVVSHDLERIKQYFPECMLLARQLVAWGETKLTITAENLAVAHQMIEAWDDSATVCMQPESTQTGNCRCNP